MADIKISQLTAKGSAIANTDLIEISESDGAGGYVTKSVTGANIIGSKQNTLISGTNIKTINSTTLLGSGDLTVQPTLVSGTNIKTINSNSILGSGDLVITGGVSSVSATTPVVATGTTTPVISLDSNYGDTQNPYASKTANNILAAPNGSSGVPTFRAIVSADIPTLNQNTTGTADNVTGIVAVANGGTGTATPSLVAGTNVTITGTFPNQTIAASGGGGGGSTGLQSAVYSGLFSVHTSNSLTASTAASHTLSSASMQYAPYIPNTTFTCVEFAINVTTAQATGLARICVYSSSNNQPTNLLYSSTDLICSATGTKSVISSFVFTQGTIYWLGIQTNVNSISFTGLSGNACIPISCSTTGSQHTCFSQTGLTYASGAPSVANPSAFVFSSSILISMKN
jgi:hypothetical protein